MWGWVGELARAFSSIGPWGIILLTFLIIIVLLIRDGKEKTKHMVKMHEGMIGALDRSSDSHVGIIKVLGRIEGILRLTGDE